MSDLRLKVERALDKSCPFGEDVDISTFENSHGNLKDANEDDMNRMKDVGIEEDLGTKAGSFIQFDQRVLQAISTIEGLTVMSLKDARKKGMVDDLEWKLVSPDKDKYTAYVYLNDSDGYFIHVTGKVKLPFQSCLFHATQSGIQHVHNIIKLEKGASLDLVTGCVSGRAVERGLHLAVSEVFVGKNADLNHTMLHEWGDELYVRPRSATVVEEGGNYINNYISLHQVRSVQMYPSVRLIGKEATTQLNSILISPRGSDLDVGGEVILEGEGSRAEVVSRTVTTGGRSIARGRLIGKAPKISAHLECNGIFLSSDGLLHAIPELVSEYKDVDMSHEASVGRVAQDQVEYLMTRGLNELQAISTIIRGFLQPSIEGLPERIVEQVKMIMESEDGL
jgi:hypothetical protein